MQLTQAIENFLLSYRGSKSVQTLNWYSHRLEALARHTGDVDVGAITIHELREWRLSLFEQPTRYEHHPSGRAPQPGGLSAHTLHGYIRAVRHFFKWLTLEGMITANPADRLELPKLPRGQVKGISQVDLKAILEAAADCPRDLALAWFLYSTACRVGGVCNLRYVDLDLEHKRARVREKGLKSRSVPLVDEAVTALQAWLEVRPDCDGDDHVFVGQRGALTPSGVYQLLKHMAKRAGVSKGWNPHNWRHRRARDLIKARVSLGAVSQMLGHEDVRTTSNIYGQLSEDDLMEAVQVPLPF